MFLTKESLVPDLKVSKLSLELYMGSSYFGHHSSLLKKKSYYSFQLLFFRIFQKKFFISLNQALNFTCKVENTFWSVALLYFYTSP